MDNEQLLDKVQNLLLGMEERNQTQLLDLEGRMGARFDQVGARFDQVGARFDQVDARFDQVDARFDRMETKLDSLSREVTLHNQLLAPFIAWSHRIEDEVIRLSAQLQEVQARLARLEKPQ